MGHKIWQERMMGAIPVGASSGGRTSLYKSHDRMNISGVVRPSVEFCFVLTGK
jgi:hypothetical protein